MNRGIALRADRFIPSLALDDFRPCTTRYRSVSVTHLCALSKASPGYRGMPCSPLIMVSRSKACTVSTLFTTNELPDSASSLRTPHLPRGTGRESQHTEQIGEGDATS